MERWLLVLIFINFDSLILILDLDPFMHGVDLLIGVVKFGVFVFPFFGLLIF